MNATELYEARAKRVRDVIALELPDRIPVTATFDFFSARYCGHTQEQLMYEPDTLWDAHLRTTVDFAPDIARNPFPGILLGRLLDVLDYRQMQWPGRQLAADLPFQFVEGEYMSAQEYDHFLSEPTDFMVRKYWPRIAGSLKGLGKLAPFKDFLEYMDLGVFAMLAEPEVQDALGTLVKAAREAERVGVYGRLFGKKLKEEGFPSLGGGKSYAPFDILSDYLRGTKGVMLDMYRRPEPLIKACEKMLPLAVEKGISSARRTGTKLVFIPLHKGLDGFMSPEQFKRFYWPTLRDLMMGLIDEGLTPSPFWEGDCTSRLPLIGDIPPGKAVYRFEATDMMKAKDILGERICIWGNVPVSILATGTPDDVRAYCKKLIDYAGKGGGLIVDASAHVNDARVENVRAMFDFTKEYGVCGR